MGHLKGQLVPCSQLQLLVAMQYLQSLWFSRESGHLALYKCWQLFQLFKNIVQAKPHN